MNCKLSTSKRKHLNIITLSNIVCSYLLIVCLLLNSFLICAAEEGDEEVIEDLVREAFENMVDQKDYVSVIFYTKNCAKCDEVLAELEHIDDDAGRYGIEMIKVNNIEEAKEHGVTTFPALIFWRKEIPILYDGEWDDDAVLKWLLSHKESVVRELNDENFDKITQVAQGGASGDWFVLFYEPSNNKTAEIMPIWELVASKLNSKMNIGKVDVEVSDELENRFGVREFPAVLFFRKSKLYTYNQPEFSAIKLMSFASRWYKTVRGERVPQKASSLDEIVSKMEYELAQRNFMLSVIGASAALVVASTALIVVFIGISWMRQPSITPPFYKSLKKE
ncbi:unnamed protein product [Gordionus sp. m RMFG-2023]|uniref:probable protein disulfide-isomerase A4 isoform X2 n=1 Tax=Gordionus sp. m RMFG-2023 TaxID=3053472 RepID=UPI0030E286C9